MPLYVLKCTKCEYEFERSIKLKDFDMEINCPECGEVAKKIPSWSGEYWMYGYNSGNGYSKKQKSHL